MTFFHAGLPQKDTVTDVWIDRSRSGFQVSFLNLCFLFGCNMIQVTYLYLLHLFAAVQTSAGLPAPGNYAVVNVDRMGFFRVNYDDDTRRLILADLDTGNSVNTIHYIMSSTANKCWCLQIFNCFQLFKKEIICTLCIITARLL